MKKTTLFLSFASLLTLSAPAFADFDDRYMDADEVYKHLGQTVSFCGEVEEVTPVQNEVHVYLDKRAPFQDLTLIITNNTNYNQYIHMDVCFTGKAEVVNNKVVVKNPTIIHVSQDD